MRQLYLSLFALVSLFSITIAQDADCEPPLTFNAYLTHLASGSSLVFASSCKMANGDLGEMLFTQRSEGGWYFEVHGNKTVRTEHLVLEDGSGYVLQTATGTRYIGKADEPILTLIMSPYFVLTPGQLDSIVQVPPRHKCFENIVSD